jgi:hypothetical protein
LLTNVKERELEGKKYFGDFSMPFEIIWINPNEFVIFVDILPVISTCFCLSHERNERRSMIFWVVFAAIISFDVIVLDVLNIVVIFNMMLCLFNRLMT